MPKRNVANKNTYPSYIDAYINALKKEADRAALQLAIRYGMIITTTQKHNPDPDTLLHIVFRVQDYQFETVEELERALKNKALL